MIDNGRTHDARAKLDELLEYAPCVLHLTEPWRVVVAGRPNVGKSSLVNALAGFDRAIVHAQPGTTRDALTTATAIDGWPVELIDTAGFHTTDDPIEQAGVRLAEERLAKADLVVLVTDAAVSWSKDDAALLAAWPGAILIHNKCDLPSAEGRRPDGLRVSALRGDGLPDLISSLGVRLVPCPLPPGQAVPWTTQQVDALRSTTEALRIGQTDQAVSLLGHLLTTRHWSE
ncbi:MAG: 50S ribosome-binding GTPase [Pirellulales bacterium]|nr:50S ribosome-binding GTPase [Pirellulales bacterium]